MPNLVDIANYALARVGQARITDLDEASEPARLAKLHIYPAIREVLREGTWKCARTRVELAQLTTGPDFGWQYAYQLPSDFIRIAYFNDIDPDDVQEELFEIHGDQLLTDETFAKIVYIRDLTIAAGDPGRLDPLTAEACYLNLAMKIAFPTQMSNAQQQALQAEFARSLRRAKAVDARDEFRPLVNRIASSTWANARYSSTNG